MEKGKKTKKIAIALKMSVSFERDLFRLLHAKIAKISFWQPVVRLPLANVRLHKWYFDGIELDAIISNFENKEEMKYFKKRNIPGIATSGLLYDPQLIYVTSDNYKIGEMGADYLVRQGFHSFAFMGMSNAPDSKERQAGFEDRLKTYGLKYLNYEITKEECYYWKSPIVKKWVREIPKPIAVMCYNQQLAGRLLEEYREQHILVPDEVAILGVDHNDMLDAAFQASFTSIEFDLEAQATKIIETLERVLEGGEEVERNIKIPPKGVFSGETVEFICQKNEKVSQALRFIRKNFSRSIGVEEIGKEVGLSRRALERNFKTYIQRTPYQELRRVRIEKAKQMLQATHETVQEIAERCGYEYAQHFIKAFRDVTGTSPAMFREEWRRAYQNQLL